MQRNINPNVNLEKTETIHKEAKSYIENEHNYHKRNLESGENIKTEEKPIIDCELEVC